MGTFEEYFSLDADKKILYVGISVPKEAKENLLKELAAYIPKEENSIKIYAHHSTIEFLGGKEYKSLEHSYPGLEPLLGKEVDVICTHFGIYEGRVGAVKCRIFLDGKFHDSLRKDHGVQHITIWTAKGGKPVDSNKIELWKPLDKEVEFTGKIKPYFANVPEDDK